MDYRERPPPGYRKPSTERTHPCTPRIPPQAQIISQEWQEQIHAHFLRPAHLWKLRSTYDQFHFHHKEDYWQTLFSLLLPYAQEKQAVVYRKRPYRNWNSSYSPAILSPRWPPLPRTDCRICFIRSAPEPSRERSSEKTSKSKQAPSHHCSYQSSKRKRSVWKELLTV